jgi:putative addiction module component (TIGR02574 family)
MTAAQKVMEQILALTPEEQAEVYENLAARLEPELSPEWEEEIRRRIQAVKDGTEEIIPAEVVFAEARRMLSKL